MIPTGPPLALLPYWVLRVSMRRLTRVLTYVVVVVVVAMAYLV